VSVIVLYQVFGVHIFLWLPRVVRRGIAFPFYQVLKSTLTPVVSMVDDGLDLVLFFVFDKVGWRSREVGPVGGSLSIR